MARLSVQIEREDRFLLDGLPKSLGSATFVSCEHIVQYYLKPKEPRFTPRIRRKYNMDTEQVSFESLQKGTKSVGVKIEKDLAHISKKKFNKLRQDQKEPRTRAIRKVRVTFDYHGMKLEIDLFRGRNKGLIILEVEHKRADDKAVVTDLPKELQPYVVSDITGNSRYTNHNLSRDPLPRKVMYREIKKNVVVAEKVRELPPKRWQRLMAA